MAWLRWAVVGFSVVLLLWFSQVPRVEGSLPEPPNPSLDQEGDTSVRTVTSSATRASDNRLPGVCRRLRRRRITFLCNSEKFCSRPAPTGWAPRRPGQTCRCPRASRCPRVFIRSFL